MTTDGLREKPSGWTYTQIGAVAPVNPSTTLEGLDDEAEVVFVPMAAVSEESGAIDITGRRTVREVSKGFVRFRGGDVIFAKITPCMENGKIAPVPNVGLPFAGSTEFQVLRPSAAIDQCYLWYFLVQRSFRAQAQRNMGGSAGQMRVPTTFLRDASIPLPPLAEQQRIVARIDELFAEIAEGEAALTRAREGLETFRRALLKSAVTGELTREWRELHLPKKTGIELMQQLRAKADEDKARGRGRVRALSVLTQDAEAVALPVLPETWAWASLAELGDFGRGKSRHRPRDDARLYGGTIPFIQTGIVANCGDFITTYSQSYSDFGLAQSRLWPTGTLCITIAANIAKTGILNIAACFPDSIVGLVPAEQIDPYFVHMWMQTVQKRIEQYAPATAQKNINLEVLEQVAVPVPPPDEAAEILRRVTAALAAHDDTLTLIDAEAADSARLRQAVLKAAFEGRLVPQDPDDEPATAMLERLAAEPPQVAPRRRGRPKRAEC